MIVLGIARACALRLFLEGDFLQIFTYDYLVVEELVVVVLFLEPVVPFTSPKAEFLTKALVPGKCGCLFSLVFKGIKLPQLWLLRSLEVVTFIGL